MSVCLHSPRDCLRLCTWTRVLDFKSHAFVCARLREYGEASCEGARVREKIGRKWNIDAISASLRTPRLLTPARTSFVCA